MIHLILHTCRPGDQVHKVTRALEIKFQNIYASEHLTYFIKIDMEIINDP